MFSLLAATGSSRALYGFHFQIPMNTLNDLSIPHRKAVSNSRMLCILSSSFSMLAWSMLLLASSMFATDPERDPPPQIVFVVPIFLCALPYGIINTLTVYDWVLKRNGYAFLRTRNVFFLGASFSMMVAIAWIYSIATFDIAWRYTGLICIAWTAIIPPAMIGGLLTTAIYRKYSIAG